MESNWLDVLFSISDQIESQVKDEWKTMATAPAKMQPHHLNASALSTTSSAPSPVTNASAWQTAQPSRIQSMVMKNDGTIILCDNDSEIVRTRSSHIEVVEIVSQPNYIRGKFPLFKHI